MNLKSFCPFCQTRLIYKHIESRKRLYCSHCHIPIYENPVPATAAILINNEKKVLLVKRKVEPKKGRWSLPGGFIEIGETPEESCLRELFEETNLQAEIDQLINIHLSDNPIYKSVLVIGYSVKKISGKIKAGDDSEEAVFFKLNKLPELAFRSHQLLLDNALKLRGIKKSPRSSLNDLKNLGAYVITSLNHIEIANQACQAGAKIIQYREKNMANRQILHNALKIREITATHGALFVVNDFIDIALLAKADGVHLGQNDIPIRQARKITPKNFIIGISTHSLDQALKAQNNGADYIGIGPVYATPTKPNYPPININTLKKVQEKINLPLVAIGGLNLKNITELKKIGINNVAMVREFQTNTEKVVKKINDILIK